MNKAVEEIEQVFYEYKKMHHFSIDYVCNVMKSQVANNVFKKKLCDELAVFYSANGMLNDIEKIFISTSIINLSLDRKDLWSNLRKSFQSLINKGRDKFNIRVIDYQNPDFEKHEVYRKLHHKTSGMIARPIKTFDLQFDMLKEDNAILVALQDLQNDKFIAFSYFFHHNKRAYYESASDDPDYFSDTPLEHYIIWTAIEYYKKRNFNFFELGGNSLAPSYLITQVKRI
ncbi:hypothetical protein DRH14_04900 [Candidatus Shapirobacteria bacterium]|nr:MAG: hypothetical protein DRH14_04900 [Candidatus Shapirobacteria bacterium]